MAINLKVLEKGDRDNVMWSPSDLKQGRKRKGLDLRKFDELYTRRW